MASIANSRPIQLLAFLALVLFFLNFEFDERYGTRINRGVPILAKLPEATPTILINYTENGFLSSKLATTARLANHIFELASIYGMSKNLHRKPAIFVEDSKYQKLIDGINKIFPKLLEKFRIVGGAAPISADSVLLNDLCCIYDDPAKLRNRTNKYLHLTGHFYQSWRYFDEFHDEILSFVKEPVDFAPLPKSDDDTFVTCIHIRRTDFVDGQHHSSSENFTRKALEFIEENEKEKLGSEKKMLVVIMGDDPNFEQKIFPDTVRARKGAQLGNTTKVFVSENTPHNDLAYSRYNCDASLITAPSSTFGWWIGYISKGQSVYYQDIRSTNDVNYKKGHLDPNDYFPPRWTAINLEKDDNIRVVNSK